MRLIHAGHAVLDSTAWLNKQRVLLKDVGTAHPVLLSTKRVQRSVIPAFLDFINYNREEHRHLASPALKDITKPREGISRPTDSKRPFQELQDVMLVQLGIFKSCPTEHYVSSAQEDSTKTRKRRKVAKIVSQTRRPKRKKEK
jgi:hypothetical protein